MKHGSSYPDNSPRGDKKPRSQRSKNYAELLPKIHSMQMVTKIEYKNPRLHLKMNDTKPEELPK